MVKRECSSTGGYRIEETALNAFAEAQEKPALYRPQAEYVGQYCGLVGCEYEPPEARK